MVAVAMAWLLLMAAKWATKAEWQARAQVAKLQEELCLDREAQLMNTDTKEAIAGRLKKVDEQL